MKSLLIALLRMVSAEKEKGQRVLPGRMPGPEVAGKIPPARNSAYLGHVPPRSIPEPKTKEAA